MSVGAILAGTAALVSKDGTQKQLQHPVEQVWVADDEQTDVMRRRQSPLTVWGQGQHVVHPTGCDRPWRPRSRRSAWR